MKRILLGFLWFVILWFGISIIGAMIAGIFVAGRTPGDIQQVEAAGGDFVHKYFHAIMLGSAVLAVIGTAIGVLPGTKRREQRSKEPSDVKTASVTHKRPLVLTLICIVTLLYYGGMLSLLFFPAEWRYMIEQNGLAELLFTVLEFALVITGTIGYWRMRRWGLFLTLVALAVLLTLDVVHHRTNWHHAWWEIVLVGVGFAYFKRLRLWYIRPKSN